jgi:hypothetical protein
MPTKVRPADWCNSVNRCRPTISATTSAGLNSVARASTRRPVTSAMRRYRLPASSRSPSNSERTSGRGPVGRNIVLAGRGRTLIGHQNQRPSSAAMDGVMNERTTSVSNSRPGPIVVPTWPMIRRSLTTMEPMVNANSRPADVTTLPVPPMARMMPVFSPAPISSLNPDTSSRL